MRKFKKIDSTAVHQTPPGISIYPKLLEPDTKFDTAGVYSVRMKFKPEDEAQLVEKLEAMFETAYEWNCDKENRKLPRANKPWRQDKDGDGLIFSFKSRASGVRDGKSWQRQPPTLFDAGGLTVPNEVRKNLRIGNGSEMIVLFKVFPFFTPLVGAGISLQLEGAQLLKVVDSRRDAAFYGLVKQSGWKLPKPSGGPDHLSGDVSTTPTSSTPTPSLLGGNGRELAPVDDTPEYRPDDHGYLDDVSA